MPRTMTVRQRIHLLGVYANEGRPAAMALAPKYGVKPEYVSKLAYYHGVKAKGYGTRGFYRKHKYHEDPRWERARAVGLVVV